MNPERLKDRLLGCWVGKAAGGTIGMPFEGCTGPLDLPDGGIPAELAANDDLDLQLLWLWVLENHGTSVRATHLAEAAASQYACYPDEYGVARWNTERGLKPPVTGRLNNAFGNGMGAAIRSEIWACLCPGRPDIAAALAREDALVDHYGDGVEAERFLAGLESRLFDGTGLPEAIQEGLNLLPGKSGLREALVAVRDLFSAGATADEAQQTVSIRYHSPNFTDVRMNLCFILIGLLWGKQDVVESVRLAVSCGMDTDCTGATCGAILGLFHGLSGLPPSWALLADAPLACHPSLHALPVPKTSREFTERLIRLQEEWALVTENGLSDPTPSTADLPEDPSSWLVIRKEQNESEDAYLQRVDQACACPESFMEHLVHVNGIHLTLAGIGCRPGDRVCLITRVKASTAEATRMMCCADAGMGVWLDGRLMIQHHGRDPRIPAFHRTQGGATVPVELKEGAAHLLMIQLWVGPVDEGALTVAFGKDDGAYAHPITLGI